MPISPRELPAYLQHIADRVSDPGAKRAADGMAKTFDRGIKTNELIRTTGAPSRPGEPPALETGRLRNSLKIVPARQIGLGRWESSDAPHTVYAHIQEYGGDIYPRVKLWLHWVDGSGTHHFAKHVKMPKRPYMRPAARRMADDGSLSRGASEAFDAAVWHR